MKTEHAGHKGSGRKTGFWGLRIDAKMISKTVRRYRDRTAVEEQLRDRDGH
jgi:hypothetical protein